jgi:GNAT superfamily N-acetyltransferase
MSRELAAAWVRGWVVSRGTEPPRRTPWGLRVDVGMPRQAARYVMLEAREPIVRDLVGRARTPALWIKTFERAELVEPWLSPDWTRDGQHWLMAVDLVHAPVAATPEGYLLETERTGDVLRAVVRAADGSVAARAQAGLAGGFATVDRVATEPAHQRRGLGSIVMRALTNASLEAGAQTGILGATVEGRALYETLGWKSHAPVTGFIYRDPGAE